MGDGYDHCYALMIQVRKASALTKTQAGRISDRQELQVRVVPAIWTISSASVQPPAPYRHRAARCASVDIAARAGATTCGLVHYPLGWNRMRPR